LLLFPILKQNKKQKTKRNAAIKNKSKYKLEIPDAARGGFQQPVSRDKKTKIFYNCDCSQKSMVVIADYMAALGSVLRVVSCYPDFRTWEVLSNLRQYVVFSGMLKSTHRKAYERRRHRPTPTPTKTHGARVDARASAYGSREPACRI
jgi:hypothetical protein